METEYMTPTTASIASRYIQVPMQLFQDEEYSKILSPMAMILYGVFLNWAGLSANPKHVAEFTDNLGRVFVVRKVEEVQEELNVSYGSASRYLSELKRARLIERVNRGQSLPAITYVLIPKVRVVTGMGLNNGVPSQKREVHPLKNEKSTLSKMRSPIIR